MAELPWQHNEREWRRLFDSQYKRPQIFISDYETGEVVFGDAFEYAKGGGVSGIDDLIRG